MNLLADENIPVSIVRALLEDRHDVMWVRDESPGVPDIEVLQLAHRKNRIILTFDKDFGELAIRDQVAPCPGHFSVIEDERIRMRPLSR